MANHFLKSCRFCSLHQNPDDPKIPKQAINIVSAPNAYTYVSVTRSLLSSIPVSNKNFTLEDEVGGADGKVNYFDPSIKFPIVRKFQSAVNIYSSPFSNSYFSVTAGIISSITASIGSSKLVQEFPVQKSFIVMFGSEFSWSDGSKMCFHY